MSKQFFEIRTPNGILYFINKNAISYFTSNNGALTIHLVTDEKKPVEIYTQMDAADFMNELNA